MDEVYRKLTGVNISEQRKLWDERGKGYYGEFLLFNELYTRIPDCCKILMNLQIPTNSGKTTEIDLLLIHESGLYVFEVKHYKGTIYGSDTQAKWTQYFRTAPNSSFLNPIKQNQYHIEALQNRYPDVPIHSIIVFTNSECDLRVKCNNPEISVCKIGDVRYWINMLSAKKYIFDAEKIDLIFKELAEFTTMLKEVVTVNETEIPLCNYVNSFISEYQNKKNELENTYNDKQKDLEKQKRKNCIFTVVLGVVCVMICIFIIKDSKEFANTKIADYKKYSDGQIASAQQELADFAQKYKEVKVFNEGNLSFSDNLISVSDVVLEPSKDIDNAIVVSFSFKHTGNDYGIRLHEDSSIILILKDGSVVECKIYNEKYPFSYDKYIGNGSTCKILPHEFYDISIGDISYVKLSNIDVWTYINYKQEIVMSGYEVEVYKAEE